MKTKKSGKALKVFKGNRLVNEARYKLTLNEQKFILFAISKIKKGDQSKKYTFHIDEFTKLLNLDSHNAYGSLRKLILSLMNRSLSFRPDADTEIFFHWFNSITYKRRQATVSFTFSDNLIPYLFNLKKRFTAYKLRSVLRLGSVYSIRIYEILKHSEWTDGQEIELSELKKMLGISNIYPNYKDFKRNVLEVAKKELISRSDMKLKYEEVKKGKKVVALFLRGIMSTTVN